MNVDINILCEDCRCAVKVARRIERQRRAARKAPRKAAKVDERAERRERLRQMRIDVLEDSGSACVVCGVAMSLGMMEMHHILSGGARQGHESRETCAALCGRCHTKAHAGDFDTLQRLRAWCEETGRTEAVAALDKRMGKILEARR